MREPRNPFRLRAAEQIESEQAFLRLFGPGMLDMIAEAHLWDRPCVFRSAAGGGKTTLLRLLTPNVLLALYENRGIEEVNELYQRMVDMGVLSEDGPQALGVFLPCTRNYAVLDDLDLDTTRKDRLFFALLNARVILALLRAVLTLHRCTYPRDLSRITVRDVPDSLLSLGASKLNGGADLHSWATQVETAVCDAIDSFDPWEAMPPGGADTLTSLDLLKPGVLSLDGQPVAGRIVLMLDDVHLLTARQRSTLFASLAHLRSGIPIWIAERFEALAPDELLSSGQQGRDYEVVAIEQFWRGRRKRFENLAYSVADRRASAATQVEVSSLAACLDVSLDSAEWHIRFQDILAEVESRVRREAVGQTKFSDWLQHENLLAGSVRDRAINWRALEILLSRERWQSQTRLDFVLPRNEFEERTDSQIRSAAELFVAHEFDLPYYFGPSRLVALASSNMEQFLWISGDEFEEVVSAAIVRKPPRVSAGRQDKLMRRASDVLWNDIPRRSREGTAVRQFLESIARFCQHTTFLPNAPYDPGVTGIAISMSDRERLLDSSYVKSRPEHGQLARVLASAIAHNLLEPTLDYKCKGSFWMVLNLNRLLCPTYWLPLQYGGFKEKTLDELSAWLKAGFRRPEKAESLL